VRACGADLISGRSRAQCDDVGLDQKGVEFINALADQWKGSSDLSMAPTLEITIMGVLKISRTQKSPGLQSTPAHEPASLMGSWTHPARMAFLAH
jgi:hypothetical protein